MVEDNNSQWRSAYLHKLVVCARIVNFDYVMCLMA